MIVLELKSEPPPNLHQAFILKFPARSGSFPVTGTVAVGPTDVCASVRISWERWDRAALGHSGTFSLGRKTTDGRVIATFESSAGHVVVSTRQAHSAKVAEPVTKRPCPPDQRETLSGHPRQAPGHPPQRCGVHVPCVQEGDSGREDSRRQREELGAVPPPRP